MTLATRILAPGEYYFGQEPICVKTLLGSCVAIVFWHPQKKIGAMCHYLLPSRSGAVTAPLDGRYADEVMQIFTREMKKHGTHPREYQVKLYGAGNMFMGVKTCTEIERPGASLCKGCLSVSCRNRLAALNETRKYGFRIDEVDMGSNRYRIIEFFLTDGQVLVRSNTSGPATTEQVI